MYKCTRFVGFFNCYSMSITTLKRYANTSPPPWLLCTLRANSCATCRRARARSTLSVPPTTSSVSGRCFVMSAICAARHSACTGQLPHFVFPFLIFSQCSRFLPSRPIKYGSSSRLQAACPIHADRGAGLYPPRISRSVYTAGLTPFFICSRIASVAGVGFLGCSRVISFFSFAIQNVGFCIIPHHCYFTKHKQSSALLITLPPIAQRRRTCRRLGLGAPHCWRSALAVPPRILPVGMMRW